jgi:hypothetical protein
VRRLGLGALTASAPPRRRAGEPDVVTTRGSTATWANFVAGPGHTHEALGRGWPNNVHSFQIFLFLLKP